MELKIINEVLVYNDCLKIVLIYNVYHKTITIILLRTSNSEIPNLKN